MAASILRPAATDGEDAGEVSTSLRELEEDNTSDKELAR